MEKVETNYTKNKEYIKYRGCIVRNFTHCSRTPAKFFFISLPLELIKVFLGEKD